jgi:sulfur carrier protein
MQLQINGNRREVATATFTLAAVLGALDLGGKRIAVELNGAIVPRTRYVDTPVKDGDRLEIVGAVGGG